MTKIIGVFNLIWFILKTMWSELRKKRTWVIVGFILWTYLTAWFNSNYYTQSPVKTWQPIIVPRQSVKPIKSARIAPVVVAQTVKPTPVPLTEEEIVKKAKYGEELWNIYMLESTRGKNDGCRREGKFGGFGVMGANGVQCYDTFEYAVERAEYWYERVRKGNTLDEALCIWNLGTKQPQCKYSQTYHTL